MCVQSVPLWDEGSCKLLFALSLLDLSPAAAQHLTNCLLSLAHNIHHL